MTLEKFDSITIVKLKLISPIFATYIAFKAHRARLDRAIRVRD